jgi:hypothetical protein
VDKKMKYEKPQIQSQVDLEGSLRRRPRRPQRRGSGRRPA